MSFPSAPLSPPLVSPRRCLSMCRRRPQHLLRLPQHLRPHHHVLVLPARRPRPAGAEVPLVEEVPDRAADGEFLFEWKAGLVWAGRPGRGPGPARTLRQCLRQCLTRRRPSSRSSSSWSWSTPSSCSSPTATTRRPSAGGSACTPSCSGSCSRSSMTRATASPELPPPRRR